MGDTLSYVIKVDVEGNKDLDVVNKQIILADEYFEKLGKTMDRSLAKLNKNTAAQKKNSADLNQAMAIQVKTVADAISKNNALVSAKKNLALADSDYVGKIQKANDEIRKNNQLISKAALSQKNLSDSANKVTTSFSNQGRVISQMRNQINSFLSIYAAERFLNKMIEIRGEFELQSVALSAMLQDRQLADDMFAKVTELALQSPFKILDLNKSLKQLKAYRIENEELIPTLKTLGDVSAGLGVSMDRLILAYGQVKAATVLRGTELRQFTEAGVPLLDQLAQKVGEVKGELDKMGKSTVSVDRIFDMISKRQIPFEYIKEIFQDMTAAGGIFYDQQKIQAQTLSGQVSILADAYAKALNEIGKSNDSILKGGISGLRFLLEEYESVIGVIQTLVGVYGAYKAVLIATNAISKAQLVVSRATKIEWNLMTIAKNKNTAATVANTAATSANNAAMAINPWAAIAVAIALATSAIVAYSKHQKKLVKDAYAAIEPLERQTTALTKLKREINNNLTLEQSRLEVYQEIEKIDGASQINSETAELKDLNTALDENIKLSKAKQAIELEARLGEKAGGIRTLSFYDAKDNLAEAQKEVDILNNKLLLFSSNVQEQIRSFAEKGGDLGKIGADFWSDFLNEKDAEKAAIKLGETVDIAIKNTGLFKTAQYGGLGGEELLGNIFEPLKEAFEKAELGDLGKVTAEFESVKNLFDKESKDLEKSIDNLAKSMNLGPIQTSVLKSTYGITEAFSESGAVEKGFAKWKQVTKDMLSGMGELQSGIAPTVSDNFSEYIKNTLEQYEKVTDELKKYSSENIKATEFSVENETKLLSLRNQLNTSLEYRRKLESSSNKDSEAIKTSLENELLLKTEISQLEANQSGDLSKTFKTLKDTEKQLKAILDLWDIISGDAGKKALKIEKERLSLLKQTKSVYDQLVKSESATLASSDIKSIFGDQATKLGLDIDWKEDLNSKGYVNFLKTLKNKTKDASLKETILKEILKFEVGDVKDGVKNFYDSFSNAVSDYKEKFDFYRDLLGVTKDDEFALKIAFDTGETADLDSFLKKQVENLADNVLKKEDFGFELSFDNIKNNFEEVMNELPENFRKKFSDVVDEINESMQKVSIDAVKAIESYNKAIKESPTGEGVGFDISRIISDQQNNISKLTKLRENAERSIARVEDQELKSSLKKELSAIKKKEKEQIASYKRLASEKLAGLADDYIQEGLGDLTSILDDLNSATVSELSRLSDALEDFAVDEVNLAKKGLNKEQIQEFILLVNKLKLEWQDFVDSEKSTQNFESISAVLKGIESVVGNLGNELAESFAGAAVAIADAFSTISSDSSSTADQISGIISAAVAVGNIIADIKQDTFDDEARALNDAAKKNAERIQMEMTINRIIRDRAEIELNKSAFFGADYKESFKLAQQQLIDSQKVIDDSLAAIGEGITLSAEGTGEGLLGLSKATETFSFTLTELMNGSIETMSDFEEVMGTIFLDPLDLFGTGASAEAYENAFKNLTSGVEAALTSMGKTVADISDFSAEEWLDFLTILEEGGYIAEGGSQALVDSLQEGFEEYQAALDQMKEIISDLAGDLGTDLFDSIVDSIKNGTDAMEEFSKSINDVLTNLIRAEVIELFFRDIFDKLQADMQASFDPGGDQSWEDELLTFFASLGPAVGDATDFLEDWDAYMQGLGFDGLTGGNLPGLSEGIAGITEKTASLLASYMNTIREEVIRIGSNNKEILELANDSVAIISSQLTQLRMIQSNTSRMANVLDAVYDKGKKSLKVA